MREEIDAAVHFFGRVIIASNQSIGHLKEFKSCLSKLLEKRFQGHWHVEIPGKGQGYRSIRIHPSEPLDPVLEQAAQDSDFNYHNFFIPMEFTLWVDPNDVSCRFGDLKATYCTVLKNEDNKSNSIDVEELLETAKAHYTRQQHISIQHNNNALSSSSKTVLQPSYVMDIYQYERHQHYPSGSPPLYGYEGFHGPPSGLWYGPGGDGFSTPPPPFTSPPSPPQFQPSFLSTAVNTTPRKPNGKGGNFRRNHAGNGVGRGSRHHQQQQHNGDGTTYNHNHNNNHNSNGSTSTNSNGGSWGGDRYHWVKGSKHHQQQQQQQSASQQNSGSGKNSK